MSRNIYVDKDAKRGGDGSINKPYNNIKDALESEDTQAIKDLIDKQVKEARIDGR